MANDRVTLDLQSEGSDEVSLATFADAIARLSKLVEALSEEVAEGSEVRWMTTPFVTAQGLGDLLAVESAASAFLEVGRALEDGVEPQFSPAVRDEALGLAGVINGEVKQMCFRNAEAEAIVRAAPAPAEPVPVGLPTAAGHAYGGVQGRVQTLNSRGSLKITLYETLSDRAVTCHLAKGRKTSCVTFGGTSLLSRDLSSVTR